VIGPQENTKTHQLFYKKVKTLAQAPNIHWVGFVPPNQLPNYYHAADIFVGPSLWEEPLGIVFLEAMAAGLPIITTHRGGIPEIVQHHTNGLLIEATNNDMKSELIKKMGMLIKKQALMKKIRRNNLKSSKQYNWANIGKSLNQTFELTETNSKS
jgi:glycosyltransferase involved in cell wall biosynthesis